MTPLLSEALQEAYASASTADVIVDTLEVVAGTQHLYLCRGFVAITLNDENGDPHVFQPVPFEFNLPGQDSTGAQTLNVGIENVDGTVAAFVQSALLSNTPIVVKYRSYLPNRLVTGPGTPEGTLLFPVIGGTTYTARVMADGNAWLTTDLATADGGVVGSLPGRLYNYAYARAFAPVDGYGVPSADDFRAMLTAEGFPEDTPSVFSGAGAFKRTGTSYWLNPNNGASNTKLLFRGTGYYAGSTYYSVKSEVRYWTSDAVDSLSNKALALSNTATSATLTTAGGASGEHWPIRLVKHLAPVAVPDLNPQNPRPLVLTVTAAELTLKGVTFAASVADFVNQPFPNAFYSFTSFPGLR